MYFKYCFGLCNTYYALTFVTEGSEITKSSSITVSDGWIPTKDP